MKISDKIFRELPKNKYFEMLPNFKTERTQKFTAIVLTLIALSFFGLFAINPTLSTITKLKKELADDQFVDQELKQKINNLSILSQKYSLLQNDLPFVLNAIPKTSDAPLLLSQIQSVAKNTNIRLKNLQNFQVEIFKEFKEQEALGKQYYSYFFSLSGEGTYEDISNFTSELINIQRIIGIEALSINRSENSDTLLQFTLRGIAYYKI